MKRFIWKIGLLTLFGIAFGHLEGVVVVYIRNILKPIPVEEWGSLTISGIMRENNLLFIEQTREAATIVILLTVALLVGKRKLESLCIFLWTFAIWDIVYYISLYVLLGWPDSLFTQDCYFLIPFPWTGPVILPVAVSGLILVITGYVLFKIDGGSKNNE
ncbi:MAG: hypothetical protein QME42_09075 [bacterium]|nr:hypothetical protein [bacterium]